MRPAARESLSCERAHYSASFLITRELFSQERESFLSGELLVLQLLRGYIHMERERGKTRSFLAGMTDSSVIAHVSAEKESRRRAANCGARHSRIIRHSLVTVIALVAARSYGGD